MNKEARYFDQTRMWHQKPEPYQVQVRADVQHIIPSDACSLLDVGCGDGFITNALTNDHFVMGVDISREALRHVHCKTLLGSITALPFADNSFDLVMANDVVEHLEEDDYKLALSELRRVASKYVLLTVPLNEQLEANTTCCADCGHIYHINHHQRSFEECSFDGLLGSAFKTVETRLSGSFAARPFDPGIQLRHQFDIFTPWESAMCPKCGSTQQVQPPPSDRLLVRILNGMRAMQWADLLRKAGEWGNRSELMALFAKRTHAYAPDFIPPANVSAAPVELDLANPLMRPEDDFAPGAPYMLYQKNQDGKSLVVHSPLEPHPGGHFILEGEGTGSALIFASDGLLGRQFVVGKADFTEVGRVAVPIKESWWPWVSGWRIEIQVTGDLALRKLSLESQSTDEKARMQLLNLCEGHHVIAEYVGGIRRSWGFFAEAPGCYPLPPLARLFSQAKSASIQQPGGMKDLSHYFEMARTRFVEFENSLTSEIEAKEAERAGVEDLYWKAMADARAVETARAKAEDAYAQLNQQYLALNASKQETERILATIDIERTRVEEAYRKAITDGNKTEQARAKVEEAYAKLDRQYQLLGSEKQAVELALEAKEIERAQIEEAYWKAISAGNGVEQARAKAEEAYAELNRQYQLLNSEKQAIEQALEAREVERAQAEEAYWKAISAGNATEEARAKAETEYAKLALDLQLLQNENNRLEQDLGFFKTELAKLVNSNASIGASFAQVEETLRNLFQQQMDVQQGLRTLPSETGKPSTDIDLMSNISDELAQQAQDQIVDIQARNIDLIHAHIAEEDMLKNRLIELNQSLGRLYQILEEQAQFGWNVREQRDLAESAYVQLSLQYQNAAVQIENLTAEKRSMSGLWGGTREILYSFKKLFRKLREKAYRIKKRCLGSHPASYEEIYPAQYRVLNDALPLRQGQLRVLVLSHMFPHPKQPTLGPFILEQVKALRQHAGVDARVVVGRPFWFTKTRNPLSLMRLTACFWEFHSRSVWRELEGVPVLFVPFRTFSRQWLQSWFYREAIDKAIPEVRQSFPFDLVHAHTSYLDGTAGLSISRRYNVPLIITEHTSPFSFLTQQPVVRWWTRRALNHADRIISVSKTQHGDVTPWIKSDRQKRSIVLHNGVDTELFHPPAAWRPDTLAPHVLFIGGFEARKNIALLLLAIQSLAVKYPGIRLSIIGAGQKPEDTTILHDTIRDLGISERVTILGIKSRQEVADILREEADILVLPSKAETFGCVLAEALACGKPVVATRCGGPEDIVTDAGIGRLCANDDLGDLVRKMDDVLANIGSFSSRAIARFAASHFGFDSIAREIRTVYDEVHSKEAK